MRTDAAKNLAKAEADRRDKLRQMEEDATESVENDLLALVEKVAKEQKLDYVLERRSVLVGGNDVTDAVIKKLPKM
jgi:Skp family chaperone for outer membrane proteins